MSRLNGKTPRRPDCPSGHKYDENGYYDSTGKLRCEICVRASWKKASAKYRAVVASAKQEQEEE